MSQPLGCGRIRSEDRAVCGKSYICEPCYEDRLALADQVIERMSHAACHSHSGMYCDDGCANIVIPAAMKLWKGES